jgi:hypothetical protein
MEPGGTDRAAMLMLMRRAAQGSLHAQRAVLDNILTPDMDLALLAGAEMLAMLAAVQGDASDWRRVAAITWVQAVQLRALGKLEDADQMAADAFTILRDLSDRGDGFANECLALWGPEFPEAFRRGEAEPASAAAVPGPPPFQLCGPRQTRSGV